MVSLAALTIGLAVGCTLPVFQSLFGIFFLSFLTALTLVSWFLFPRRSYVVAAVFLLACLGGVVRVSLLPHEVPAIPFHHRVSYTGIVVGSVKAGESSVRVPVRVSIDGEPTTLLVVTKPSTVTIGDRVWVSGLLLKPEPFATEGGRIFRYDEYLARRDMYALLNFATLVVDEPYAADFSDDPILFVHATLAQVQKTFINGLTDVLPEPYAALASGVVIGGTQGLGTKIEQEFRVSGLTQIVVLSGYNVTIVAAWVMSFLHFCRMPRRLTFVTAGAVMLFFVGVVGGGATALRALSMGLIALFARASAKSYEAGRALLAVVTLFLLVDPRILFDVGFELSVAATAGIIWLSPIFEKRCVALLGTLFGEALATTLAAQLAVLPLLLYATGSLSLVALPANVAASLVVPFAMATSFAAGIVGAVVGSGGALVAFPSYLATAALLCIATKSAALPFAAFSLPPFSPILVIALYAALVLWARSKRASLTDQFTFFKNAST